MVVTFLPARGRAISSHEINKVPWCVASDVMLRRSYAKFAYLKSLVLRKDQAIRAARKDGKTSLILGRNEPLMGLRRRRRWRPRSAPPSGGCPPVCRHCPECPP